MYLTRYELQSLLKKPYFNTFLSKNVSQYSLYRGKYNASVLTLRYSVLVPEFTENDMVNSVINEVMEHFPPSIKAVKGLIEYDVILVANPMDQVNPSYYFWRANSNTSENSNQETTISLNHDSIFLFIHQAARILPSDLDLFFVNSNVSVVNGLFLKE